MNGSDGSDAPVDPTDPYVRRHQTFARLTDDQIARATRFGVVEELPAGTVLFERGDRTVDFFIVLSGSIEILEHGTGDPAVLHTHVPGEFTGELDHFNNREILVNARMGTAGRIVRTSRTQFRRLLAAEPDIAEVVMRAFILRRVGLIDHQQSAALLIGSRHSSDTLRIRQFLTRNGYPLRSLDLPDAEALRTLDTHGLGPDDVPVIVLPRGRVLRNPGNRELVVALGIAEQIDADELFDVVIVGAGPAGLAAAVYGASEGLATIILESYAPGGQAGTSSKIENYLGFPNGISGEALAGRAQVQAQKFGARIAVGCHVAKLHCSTRPYALVLDDGSCVRARTVVVATGARYRKLDLESFDRFEGNGIHYAATGTEANLCEGEDVIVVGGGNSAGQAALFLCRHARHVHMLVRGSALAASMSSYLIGRIQASDRITLYTNSEITALDGDRHLERVTWYDRAAKREHARTVSNLFSMLGATPNTEWLHGCVTLDERGFVQTGGGFDPDQGYQTDRPPHALETSLPGVFAVGDVRAGSIKRVAAGVGEGSIVVSALHQVLAGT